MSNQLKTNIDKAQVTSLCADAIRELERAVRLHPEWPAELYPIAYGPAEVAAQLERARHQNDTEGLATGHSIFGEEYMEFLEATFKPGNIVAARIELVQAMAMLIRISCHLDEYVAKDETGNSKLETGKTCPVDEKKCFYELRDGNCFNPESAFIGQPCPGCHRYTQTDSALEDEVQP